jgi:hypothetical protein
MDLPVAEKYLDMLFFLKDAPDHFDGKIVLEVMKWFITEIPQ